MSAVTSSDTTIDTAPGATRLVARRRWRAMGSDAEVIVVGGSPLLVERAVDRIAELETRWSRFRPDSEISRLNRSPGTVVRVHSDTAHLVTTAVEAWHRSRGAYDPTLLGEVVRAGYDRTIEDLPADRPVDPAGGPTAADPSAIEIDGTLVRLPPGAGFDPGGIAKGLAADLVTAELVALSAEGVCLNLGGDLRVRGRSPGGGGWTIAVDRPAVDPTEGPGPLALVGLTDGAVATSTTLRRAWTVAGRPRHHLIDPRTGRSSRSDLVQATAIAATAWEAEWLAKAVLLGGTERAFDLVPDAGSALAVASDGTVLASHGLARHLGGQALPGHVEVAR